MQVQRILQVNGGEVDEDDPRVCFECAVRAPTLPEAIDLAVAELAHAAGVDEDFVTDSDGFGIVRTEARISSF
jgi:hypothetical protein